MADDVPPAELKQRLWDEVRKEPFGMLALVGGAAHHFQPMACYADVDHGAIWFFTKNGTDLVRDTGSGHEAMFILQSKDQEFQACIDGYLVQDYDRARLELYWSSTISAWFPEGKDDPELTMLKLQAGDARVWASKRGPLKFGFEVAKANATHTEPNITTKADIPL